MHIVWIQCIPCFCRSVVTPSCSCAQITESCSRVISIHLSWFTARVLRIKATRPSLGTIRKKIQSFPFLFLGYFPRFHKQVLRSGKQHIEREMVGRRRKLDEKKRGVYGVIIQPPLKKATLSPFPAPFAFIISTNANLFSNWSRSWWRCRGFGRWWANCFQTFDLNASFFHRLSSPFFSLVRALLLAPRNIAVDGPRW